jgi:hypothetical protein
VPQQPVHPPDVSGETNVIAFAPRPRAVPPLTSTEILQLRQMLREFALIKQSCPMARRVIQEE